ncbi:forkhead box protein P1 isoform X1 [Takifugu flavidus]|uniref:forkhead box protein P1 isoform X1 n=2 Tax=Takifugu flavidus TaxID=433684 RepID=UPI0025449FE9|nr:forkhead box protein P1 isoform X1 [Takifugu flavidus]
MFPVASGMPEMSADRLMCELQQAQPTQSRKVKEAAELRPPLPPDLSRHVMSPPTSGNQSWSSQQQRPSVLRQVFPAASRQQRCASPQQQAAENVPVVSMCKEEPDVSCLHLQSSSPQMGSSSWQSHPHLRPPRRDSPTQPSSEDSREGAPEGSSTLFVSGLCRWPGCDSMSEDFPSFLKHLHSEHSRCDRSVAQWKVQQDIVQCLEAQLILEKQKLLEMQLHLRLSEDQQSDSKAACDWSHSLPLFLPHTAVTNGDGGQQWVIRHVSQRGYRAEASAHFLPDLIQSPECYKHANIRPPYTYAYMIRWSILESPDKQRSLNEIYNWFTTKFSYFRNNTATWKNAVRHNLSLHKCFVRVEGGKGAVWTVDETEYQRRKGQKYHRDCPVKWFKFPYYCPEES